MDKRLLAILKKRYGFFLILCILFIFLYYAYTSIQGLEKWKDVEHFYASEEFKASINKDTLEDYSFVFEETQQKNSTKTLEEIQEEIKLNALQIFHEYTFLDSLENETLQYNATYFRSFNEEHILLILFICLLGFSLFFFDLKTSFNEFLFSSSISKLSGSSLWAYFLRCTDSMWALPISPFVYQCP